MWGKHHISYHRLSLIAYHRSSIDHQLSSIVYPLSSIVCLTSIVCLLSSIVNHLPCINTQSLGEGGRVPPPLQEGDFGCSKVYLFFAHVEKKL